MKELPYFLLLIKENIVLWTIINTGSSNGIDLKDIDHDYWTSQYLQINNFSLNDHEKFNEVWITLTEISTMISFRPSSPKYLDSTKYYFGEDAVLVNSAPYYIEGVEVSDVKKSLGTFDIGLEMPVYITIGKSSVYGYYVDFTMYKKGWADKIKDIKH